MTIPADFLEEVRSRVSLAEVVQRRVRLAKRSDEYVGLCPFHSEKGPSFTVIEAERFYYCFGCGEHGDVFDFTMKTNNITFLDAVERLARQGGLVMPARGANAGEQRPRAKRRYESLEHAHSLPPRSAEDMKSISFAEAIWDACVPATGSLVERYWHDKRGLTLPIPAVIRYGAAIPYGYEKPGCPPRPQRPAMIAKIQAVDGSFAGVHATYLRPDGKGKDPSLLKTRLVYGRVAGCAIRLSDAVDELALGEGIESTVSYMTQFGVAGWAAISTSGMSSIILPRPPVAFVVTLVGENDGGPSERTVAHASARLRLEGRLVNSVFPAEEFKDFNDPYKRAM
jgi:DNA primase